MNISESGGEERMSKAESAIQALSSELQTTKQLMEDMAKRERQVRVIPYWNLVFRACDVFAVMVNSMSWTVVFSPVTA